ncbi:MAG: acyl-ACP--UDP-N-acetylglucosamine O-acyltransferase [Fibrobacteraceae bacterium]
MIHPSAYVSPSAKVPDSACVGPWCVVDDGAELGENVVLQSRVHVCSWTSVGDGTVVGDGSVLGGAPQDLKYAGEPTRLVIGGNCTIREYCTLNRGTAATGETRVGNSVLIMAYTHVAHDCRIGDFAVISNRVDMGGHVHIGEYATVGGQAGISQCMTVGAYSFVGAMLKVDRDVPPASRALGSPLAWAGLNLHALRKYPDLFPESRIVAIDRAYRELYRSGRPIAEIAEEYKKSPEPLLRDFFETWRGTLIRP